MSAVRLAGLTKELQKQGQLERVLAHCREETRAAARSPHLSRHHPGQLLLDLNQAVVREMGTAGLERLNYASMKAAYSGITRSLVAVAMALGGRSPGSLFARLPETASRVLVGVRTTWKEEGASKGVLSIEYPAEVPAHTEFAWRGSLRLVAEFAGGSAKVDSVVVAPRRFEFHLSW